VKAEYINPLIRATTSVFETMLGCTLTRHDPYLITSHEQEHEVSGVIGFSGAIIGCVVLNISREVAIEATRTLLQETPTELNADVIDTVGELANMVAGAAKSTLDVPDLKISLPTIVTGDHHGIQYPSNVKPIGIPFTCEWGEVLVKCALIEEAAAVAAS